MFQFIHKLKLRRLFIIRLISIANSTKVLTLPTVMSKSSEMLVQILVEYGFNGATFHQFSTYEPIWAVQISTHFF